MLDRRGFFGWLVAAIGMDASKEMVVVQTKPDARPLFVMTFGYANEPSLATQEQIRDSWYKLNCGNPPGDLVMVPAGTQVNVQFPGMVQTDEKFLQASLKITAPDLATYERLRELCLLKPHVVQFTAEEVEHPKFTEEQLACIRRGFRNPMVPLEIHNR